MAPDILLAQLLIDFGLVVLILMVQWSIYPSFLFYSREDLISWHKKYTGAIAIVVGPLMILQLLLSIYFMFGAVDYLYGGTHLALVVATWISTALQFVPIHNRIANSSHSQKDLENLVKRNWLRVVLWVLIFILSLTYYKTV